MPNDRPENVLIKPDLTSMIPDIQLPQDRNLLKKVIPLGGKLITSEDGFVLGHGNFKSLKNLRPALGHTKGIGGMTKINTTALTHAQDYTDYIEADVAANRVSVAATAITVTDLDTDEDVYVVKDFGANFFKGNFEHRVKFTYTAGTGGGSPNLPFCYVWGMSNYATSLGQSKAINEDSLTVYVYNGTLYVEEVNGAAATSDYYMSPTPTALTTGVPYYLKIVRDESVGTYGKLYCYVYSDAAFSTLLDTMQVTLTEKQNFRYLFAMSGYQRYAGGTTWTGTIENLTIPKIADSLYHFRKDQPAETHLLAHDEDGNIFDNETAIPSQGNFNPDPIWTDTDGAGEPRFSRAPLNHLAYADGIDVCTWGGDEAEIGAFLTMSAALSTATDVPANVKDYTERVRNTLQTSDQVAIIGSGVPAECVLLLHGDGNFTDSSTATTKTVVASGAVNSSTQAKFGTGSIYFDGVNDFIYVNDDSADPDPDAIDDFYMGTGIFFWGAWVKFETLPTAGNPVFGLFDQTANNDNNVNFDFGRWAAGVYYLAFSIRDGGVSTGTAMIIPETVTTGVWYYVAIIRGWGGDSDSLALTWNGNIVGITYDLNGADWPDLPAVAAADFEIGRSDDNTGTKQYFNGWMDEIECHKGRTPYTSNFNPPPVATKGDNKYGLIGSTKPLQGIKFYIPSGNGNSQAAGATFTFKEFIGTSWASLSVTDGTTKITSTGSVTFTSTVNTSKPKYINNTLLYWYQFYLDVGQAQVYYVTVDAPFQPIRDTWDGSDRKIASLLLSNAAGTYTDRTLAVRDNYYSMVGTTPDANTYVDIGNDATLTLYAGFTERQRGLIANFIGTNVNAVVTAITIAYSDGQSATPSIAVPSMIDYTATAGATCAKGGVVTWEEINESDEFPISLNGGPPLYYYKVTVGGALTASTYLFYLAGIPAPKTIKGYNFPFFAQKRLFLCKENKFWCSALTTPHIFNGVDSFIDKIGGDEHLKAAGELFAQAGNNLFSFIVFLKQSQVWAMAGSGPDEWKTYPLSTTVGIAAVDTLKNITLPPDNPLNMNKSALIWLGADDAYITDGRFPIPVGGDIKDLFDKRHANYIGAANLPNTSAIWDESSMEYHLIFSTGPEWVLNLKEWKWYEVERGDGNEIICGCEVEDEYGSHYTYGVLETGYVERLEYGNDFDSIDITHEFQIGDEPLHEKDLSVEARIVHMFLISTAKTVTSNSITLTHYIDTNASGTAYTLSPVKSGYRLIEGVMDINSIPGLLHSIKGTMVTDNETIGFEPFALVIFYEIVRQHTTRTDNWNDSINELDSGTMLTITSDLITTKAGAAAAWQNGTFLNEQWSELVFNDTNGGGSVYAGPAVRMSGTVTNAYGYAVIYRAQTGAEALFVWKWNNQDMAASGSQLGAQFNTTLTQGDTLKLDVSGSTLTVYVNGTSLGTRSDSAIASGSPGLVTSNAIPGTDWITWSGWEVGGSI